MATSTRNRAAARSASAAGGGARFTRAQRPASSPTRRGVASGTRFRRKPEPQSVVDRALSAVTGVLPGKSSAKRAGSKVKGNAGMSAGVALLAAAGGVAFAKRDKLTSMLGRGESATQPADYHPPVGGSYDTPPVGGGFNTTPDSPPPADGITPAAS